MAATGGSYLVTGTVGPIGAEGFDAPPDLGAKVHGVGSLGAGYSPALKRASGGRAITDFGLTQKGDVYKVCADTVAIARDYRSAPWLQAYRKQAQ